MLVKHALTFYERGPETRYALLYIILTLMSLRPLTWLLAPPGLTGTGGS